MNEREIARELVLVARELVGGGKTVFKARSLQVVRDGVYGIFCQVTGDPGMSKRAFVSKHYEKVAELMDDFDRDRHVVGTINFKKAKSCLDDAFRTWVEKAIGRGEKISAKAMDGIDMDDGGDNFGKMWDIEESATESGYVLKGRYWVKEGRRAR